VPALAVTDAHALIWAATGKRRKLGRAARRMFQRTEEGRAAIFVPTIVLVEIGEAARLGEIRFGGGFDRWARALVASRRYLPADLTSDVALAADALHAIPDRGDRLIAATAAVLGVPLVTRDPSIALAAGVEVLWG
jgi:PIN domain nuclease of toxin-antitoxin system